MYAAVMVPSRHNRRIWRVKGRVSRKRDGGPGGIAQVGGCDRARSSRNRVCARRPGTRARGSKDVAHDRICAPRRLEVRTMTSPRISHDLRTDFTSDSLQGLGVQSYLGDVPSPLLGRGEPAWAGSRWCLRRRRPSNVVARRYFFSSISPTERPPLAAGWLDLPRLRVSQRFFFALCEEPYDWPSSLGGIHAAIWRFRRRAAVPCLPLGAQSPNSRSFGKVPMLVDKRSARRLGDDHYIRRVRTRF